MEKNTNISIVVASDNHYAVMLAAFIKSIEENHITDERLDFYILDDKISADIKNKINASINKAVTNLIWLKTSVIVPHDISIPVDHTAMPFTTYYRLFAPGIVPEKVDRLIYLDVDMIVLEDISKLWNINIEDKLFAAVQDWQLTVSCSWGGIPNYEQLGIPADTEYFNAGLLVIDTKKWRRENVTRRVIEFMNTNMKFVNFADQYGLNGLLYSQWYRLDPRWNWFAQFDNDNPFIIHFLDIKPIFKNYRSKPEFKELFYKYLRLTAFHDYKPISNYNRVLKKVFTKLKKQFLKLFALKA